MSRYPSFDDIDDFRIKIACDRHIDYFQRCQIRAWGNYFAPDYDYLYDPYSGETMDKSDRLFRMQRIRDGEIWAAMLDRDIKKAFIGYPYTKINQ